MTSNDQVTVVGSVLKELRGSHTLDEVAAQSSVSRSTISNIETGRLPRPSPAQLSKIGHALENFGVADAIKSLLGAAGYAVPGGPVALLVNLSGFARQWGAGVTPAGMVDDLGLCDDAACQLRGYYPYGERPAPEVAAELELAKFLLVECRGSQPSTVDAKLFHEALVLLSKAEGQEVYVAGFETADILKQLRSDSEERVTVLLPREHLLDTPDALLEAAGPKVKPVERKPAADPFWLENLGLILERMLKQPMPEDGYWSIGFLARELREGLKVPGGQEPATYVGQHFAQRGGPLYQVFERTADGGQHQVVYVNHQHPEVQRWRQTQRTAST